MIIERIYVDDAVGSFAGEEFGDLVWGADFHGRD